MKSLLYHYHDIINLKVTILTIFLTILTVNNYHNKKREVTKKSFLRSILEINFMCIVTKIKCYEAMITDTILHLFACFELDAINVNRHAKSR